jgi:prephenate dehydrogenase
LVGVGAFGEFCLPYLTRHFDVQAYDAHRDLAELARCHDIHPATLPEVAAQDIVLLAMPVRMLAEVAHAIAPHVRRDALVLDVCSIKVKPLAILAEILPPFVDIVGTHPLFGPQSGRNGIVGLRVAVCPVRGRRARLVGRFLRVAFGLEVIVTTPDAHDRQMAYVQGLTHLISRTVMAMDIPKLDQTTATFGHLMRMVDTVRHDSDALFRTIAMDNPYVDEVKTRFFKAAQDLEASLASMTKEGAEKPAIMTPA